MDMVKAVGMAGCIALLSGLVDGQNGRRAAHDIDIPGKHLLEKDVINVLEGSCQKCDKNWEKQRFKTSAFDFRLCNPK